MKILQVTPFFGEQFGGTERFCYNLSRQLVNRGHQVDVYTSRTIPTTPKHEIVEGVQVFRFYTPTVIWQINPIAIMFQKLLNVKYDIIHIHSHLYFASNQTFLAKIIRTTFSSYPPVVLHLHGGLGAPPSMGISSWQRVIKNVFDKTLGAISMRSANHIIAQSQADANKAAHLYPCVRNKTTIILNAIDLSAFPPFSNRIPNNHQLLFVGDLEHWKGVSSLIEAMRLLKKQKENFSLKIVGVGSLSEGLQRGSDGLDVEFLHQQPHAVIPKLMAQSFACILPSLWEGIPTVGLEAMASGTPFIGTNVGGIPEIITNNETGMLIESNSPAQLVNAILALKNEKLRNRIRKAAYNLVSAKHNISDVAEKVETVYEYVLTS